MFMFFPNNFISLYLYEVFLILSRISYWMILISADFVILRSYIKKIF